MRRTKTATKKTTKTEIIKKIFFAEKEYDDAVKEEATHPYWSRDMQLYTRGMGHALYDLIGMSKADVRASKAWFDETKAHGYEPKGWN